MAGKAAKRQKFTGAEVTSSKDIISVDDSSYSIVVEEGIVRREMRTFNVPKRSVFLQAELDDKPPSFKFENVSKSVGPVSQFHFWEVIWNSDSSFLTVKIYYDRETSLDRMDARCQLQFMSKGTAERVGQITEATFIGSTSYRRPKYQGMSIESPFSGYWVETTDQIRVILAFPSLEPTQPAACASREHYSPSFGPYYLSKDFSDIVVSSNSMKWPAHKMVLAYCSEVFKRMFQTEMKETLEGNIKLNDFDPLAVKEMLRFVYTGHVKDARPVKISMDIFRLADTYNIKGLKGRVVPMVLNGITIETAPEMYSFGKLYNATPIMTQALAIAKANKKQLLPDGKTIKRLTDAYPEFTLKLCTDADD